MYWTLLERRLRRGKMSETELPLLRQLAAEAGGSESFLRAVLAMEVFAERGLLHLSRGEGRLTISLVPTQGKVDLFACPYLSAL